MANRCNFPESDRWRQIFAADLGAEQQDLFERHLESCPACQAHFDRDAAAGDTVLELLQRVGPAALTPRSLALQQLMGRLMRAKPACESEPADLYFLQPCDRPDVLGLLGEYEVQAAIGQGGMGIVLRAYQPALDRLVAIKVLAPALAGCATARRRFTREARAAAAVSHDHIVGVYSVREAEGLPYLVMPYIQGESLQARLHREGPLPLTAVVRLGLQTARGLAAAHAQGLVHRDIKPANLLLEDGTDRVKITDFGLARLADDVHLTRSGTVAGTPEYMAPEQARGGAVDERADLFSLGSVLFAACTGMPPFRASTALAVLRQVCEQEVSSRAVNPAVPAWLDAFVVRLMAKDPGDRFPSAAEVARLLESYLAHLQQPGMLAAPALPPARSSLRRWWPGLLLLLITLSLTATRLPQVAPPQPERPRDVSQDFRGGQAPRPPLELIGPDADEVMRPEEDGVRISLPAHRMRLLEPVGIAFKTPIAGDFEITGSYEFIDVDMPTSGTGVGIALNVATEQPRKFSRFGRFLLPGPGSVFLAEHWNNDAPQDRFSFAVPTQQRSGKLRIVRKGATLIYLATEGAGDEFREISRSDFGTEPTAFVRFVVHNNNSPAAIDARLVDLHIRVEPAAAGEAAPRPRTRLLAFGLSAGLLLVLGLAAWAYGRRHRYHRSKNRFSHG